MSNIEQALKAALAAIDLYDYTMTVEESEKFAKAERLCKSALAEIGKCEPVNEVYEFEKWITGNTLIRTNLSINLDYADPLAEIAYRAWKARAKLYTSPQPIDKCEPVAYDKNKIRSEVMSKAPLPFGVCDAIDLTMQAMENHYTSPQQREWKDIDLSEYENQGLGVIAEEICTKLKQLNKG